MYASKKEAGLYLFCIYNLSHTNIIIRKEPFNEVWLKNGKVFPHSIFRIPFWKCATNERITIKTGEQSLEYIHATITKNIRFYL
jgi:hypothetical protein